MKYIVLILALAALLLGGCGTTALVYAEAPTKEQDPKGIRVEVDAGTFSGGASVKLENVGKYVRITQGYKGPVPPGFSVYEEAPQPEPEPE